MIRRHIARLPADLLFIPAYGAVPDGGQFFILQRRLTLGGLVQKNLTGFFRVAVADDHPPRKARHGLIPCARDDDVANPARFLFPGGGRDLHLTFNGQPALVPDGVAHIRAEDKPGGVQRVIVEEGILAEDGFLQGGVVICILCWLDLEIHMELRSRSLTVLRKKMMPAERNRVADVRHHLIQLFRRNPLRRVLRVVVVAVHDHHVRLTEVVRVAVIVVVFRAHVIHPDSLLKLLGAGDLHPIGVVAVPFIAQDVRCLQNQFHACPSILCLCLCCCIVACPIELAPFI